MSKFIMTVGLPGAGKSTWIKRGLGFKDELVDAGGISVRTNPYTVTAWISSDNIREANGWEPGTHSNEVFALMQEYTLLYLEDGADVVYDATNLHRKFRMALLEKLPACEKVCVIFRSPYHVCCSRNLLREPKWVVPEDVMKKMLKTFQVPMYQEGFDKIMFDEAPSQDMYSQSRTTIGNYMIDMRNFDQCNPHHTHNLLDHSLSVTEYVKENYPSDFTGFLMQSDLNIVAAFHDVGKLYTRTFINMRGEETAIAHYYNHENVGAYMFLSSDFSLHPATTEQIIYMTALIEWHMRPFTWETSSKAKAKDIKFLSHDRFVKALELLHTADVQDTV